MKYETGLACRECGQIYPLAPQAPVGSVTASLDGALTTGVKVREARGVQPEGRQRRYG